MSLAAYVDVVPVTTLESSLGAVPNLERVKIYFIQNESLAYRTYGVVWVPVTYMTDISSRLSVMAIWTCLGVPSVSCMVAVTDASAMCSPFCSVT